MRSPETQRVCALGAILAFIVAFWTGLLDLVFGGLSLAGAIIVLVFVAAALLFVVFARLDERSPTLADCTCPRHIQNSEFFFEPKEHRPSCPVRLGWERERREDDCGCGPPIPKQRNYMDPRP